MIRRYKCTLVIRMFSSKHHINPTILLLILTSVLNSTSSINFRNDKATENSRDSELTFTQLAGKYGYPTEEHSYATEDGYVLTIFRIKGRLCGDIKQRPVLLMHGLLMSSDSFLDAGPEAGLAYLLADACHDVWVGNSRGNYNSRSHITLDPDKDARYWNFSFDEMGLYDAPATIDYILDTTGYGKLNYVGFAQGASIVFVMCSEKPGYCDKVNVLLALHPATRQINTSSQLFRLLCISFARFERVLDRAGIHEVLGKPNNFPDVISIFCQFNVGSEAICRTVLSVLDGYHSRSVSRATIKSLFGHFMAGTSVHNMARYGQNMVSDDFYKFDYGVENFSKYASPNPPKYNLTATTAPVVVVFGENDGMVDKKDVHWLVSQLPNVVEAWLVPDPKWNHFDTMFSQHSAKLIFPKIQQYLLQYN